MRLPIPSFARWLPMALVFLGLVTAIPFAIFAKARNTTSEKPRLHIIRDMDNQERFNAQQENTLFADRRAMRPPVAGTVARGELRLDTRFEQGRGTEGGDDWVTTFPSQLKVDAAFLGRGKERYEIFCAPCHGGSGYGDGMVERRVAALKKQQVPGTSTWASPANYHVKTIREQPVGQLFNAVSNGKGNMAGYRSQIPVHDRWAIVAYVRALQLSQNPE
jgi:mono/diheme cytochrome c family protein